MARGKVLKKKKKKKKKKKIQQSVFDLQQLHHHLYHQHRYWGSIAAVTAFVSDSNVGASAAAAPDFDIPNRGNTEDMTKTYFITRLRTSTITKIMMVTGTRTTTTILTTTVSLHRW